MSKSTGRKPYIDAIARPKFKRFRFRLCAANGRVIVWSEIYNTKRAMLRAIEIIASPHKVRWV